MRQVLMTAKWFGLSILLLAVVAACVALGVWQWSRIQQGQVPEQPVVSEPVALGTVYSPGEPVPDGSTGRFVEVDGRYDPSRQLLVPDRLQRGAEGYWILTPLVVDGGGVVPVVRGWSPTSEDAAVAPPGGPVSVVGRLSISESYDVRAQDSTQLPEGQVEVVSSAELISLWDGELYQGFILLTEQDPPSDLETVLVSTNESQPISWQSLAYTVQWWLIALFALFFWWRMLQADLADLRSTGTWHDGAGQSPAAEFLEVGE